MKRVCLERCGCRPCLVWILYIHVFDFRHHSDENYDLFCHMIWHCRCRLLKLRFFFFLCQRPHKEELQLIKDLQQGEASKSANQLSHHHHHPGFLMLWCNVRETFVMGKYFKLANSNVLQITNSLIMLPYIQPPTTAEVDGRSSVYHLSHRSLPPENRLQDNSVNVWLTKRKFDSLGNMLGKY